MNTTRIHPLLVQLYGEELGTSVLGQVTTLLDDYRGRLPKPRPMRIDQRDAVLITYADQIREPGKPALQSLTEFCKQHFAGIINAIHILPFYPWSSDDGFSVIDYRTVDPRYGDWKHIQTLGSYFRLMFDAVINHISVQSAWFQAMLHGDERYLDYFVTPVEGADLTQVVRPRALPLLTVFLTAQGEKKIWTTFSDDQADLNYQNPAVLLEILDILLFYVSQGAEFIRLDAIGYLWKESGTTSIHLPQTHWVIQLFRAALDEIAPHVILITETNVPHAENISYFGDGANEAQMVYNFSLPPLVLQAFQTGSAESLSRWASTLKLPSDKVTFFNFLASHDGIGVNPLRGILSDPEIDAVVKTVQKHGGLVSFKSASDGTQIPYELNINYFDALNDPQADDPLEVQVERFVTAHAILFSMIGVPGIYFHSLVGSRGWTAGAAQTGRPRTINREKLLRSRLEEELTMTDSVRARVLEKLSLMLKVRAASGAFHPHSAQQIVDCGKAIFAVARRSSDGEAVLCLQNVSGDHNKIDPGMKSLLDFSSGAESLSDLIGHQNFHPGRGEAIELLPYQTLWLVGK
jgi:glucosylglycerate phosphorylase